MKAKVEKVFTKTTKLLPFMWEDPFPLVLLISIRNILFEREQAETRLQEVIFGNKKGRANLTLPSLFYN